ncbi:CLUMA_CG015482, isoform A [Clunio marinus]|uniref:CLUMA_CG015482, isoform A n=1 Tax=Clunio marinus TaxID=568069 RepID=A0A1J1IU04_9DIPT|nr:CLUMA_CG015482, isoform A [Clunio marinus]
MIVIRLVATTGRKLFTAPMFNFPITQFSFFPFENVSPSETFEKKYIQRNFPACFSTTFNSHVIVLREGVAECTTQSTSTTPMERSSHSMQNTKYLAIINFLQMYKL